MSKPGLNKDRQQQYEIALNNYRITHGKVERRILLYKNKSKYDTRIFKTMLSESEINRNAIKEELRDSLKAELIDEIKKELQHEKENSPGNQKDQ